MHSCVHTHTHTLEDHGLQVQGNLIQGVHDLGTELHTQGTDSSNPVNWDQTSVPSGITLGNCQALVEIEAEETGEQLAGSSPPDEVGQHATE